MKKILFTTFASVLALALGLSAVSAQERGESGNNTRGGGLQNDESTQRGGWNNQEQPQGGVVDRGQEQRRGQGQGRGPGARGGSGGFAASEVPAPKKMRESLSEFQRANLEVLRQQMLVGAFMYLEEAQSESGSFSSSPRVGIGPTLVCAIGILRAGAPIDDPTLAKALKYLESAIREDGGVYSEGGRLASYESCLGLVCFELANKAAGDGRYDATVANAEKFVRSTQYNEANGISPDDERFGGVGYGSGDGTRPDLSNTQFFIEALREVGADENDQAIQDALVFVSRCQNLETEDSPTATGGKGSDGGFIYTFISPDENPAGQEVDGGLRSYGSMTYAGLKSLIYAGLTKEDPRVEAATNWIRENYTLTQNPGLGKRGLYYYYHTLSKCLNVMGEKEFVDKDGVAHDWRSELIETLALAQNEDGSWVNDDRMWYETDANLVTGYVMTVLTYCAEEEREGENPVDAKEESTK